MPVSTGRHAPSVAVGAGVTSCPPRRSRRARRPRCGQRPAPGSCRRSHATGIRGLGGPSSSSPWARAVGDIPVPALCPGHALALALPSTGRLPSTLSATSLSAGVVRGFIGTMQPSDSSDLPVRLRLLAFPNRPGTARAVAGGRRSPRFRHDPLRLELVSDPGGATVLAERSRTCCLRRFVTPRPPR